MRHRSLRIGTVLGLTLALAACGGAPDDGNLAEPENETAPEALPDADANASLADLGNLPPLGEAFMFVGRWAAEEGLCNATEWRFTPAGLETPAGSVCRFDRVEEVPGGYDIAARCTAEGPEAEDRIEIRFAESARAMLFESGTVADAGLTYCGPPDGEG